MEDGNNRPIAFASRTLTVAEKKYTQLEKEGIAIVFGTKSFTIISMAESLKFNLITNRYPFYSVKGKVSLIWHMHVLRDRH